MNIVVAAATFAVTGSPQAALWAYNITSVAQAVLFPAQGPHYDGPRLNDLRVQNSAYGIPIPRAKGAVRMAGNVIWATKLVEVRHDQDSGGKGGDGGGSSSTTYTYHGNFAVMLTGNEICGVEKVWANGSLLSPSSYRVYTGSETQLPDPLIEAHVGVGSTPAYRGRSYLVFEMLALESYGNALPTITAEVRTMHYQSLDPSLLVDGSTTVHSDHLAYVASRDEIWVMSNDANRIIRYTRAGAVVAGIGSGAGLYGVSSYDAAGDTLWAFSGTKLVKYDCAALTQTEYAYSGIWNIWIAYDGALWIQTAAKTLKSINKSTGATIRTVTTAATVFCLAIDSAGSIWYTSGSDKVLRKITTGGTETSYTQSWTYNAGFLTYDSVRDVLWVGEGDYVGALHRVAMDGTTNVATVAVSPSGPGGAGGLYIDTTDQVLWVANNSSGAQTISKVDLVTNAVLGTIHLADDAWEVTPLIGNSDVAWLQGYYADLMHSVDVNICTLDPCPVADIISEECALVGLTAADIDVSAITSGVRGYMMSRRASVRSNLEPLAAAFSFDATESDWKLKFLPRGQASIRTLTADDLAAHDDGAEIPPEVTTQRAHDLELPSRIDVTYMRRESDYQNSTQSARRESVSSDTSTTVEWPMVLSDDQALHSAQTQMAEAWIARQSGSFSTTRKHADLDPCDVITLPIGGADRTVRLKKKDESRAGQVNFEYECYESTSYTWSAAGTGTSTPAQTVPAAITGTVGLLMDLPALIDSHDDAGFYWAGGPVDAAGTWNGAALYKSSDSGASYLMRGTLDAPATIGVLSTTLGAGRTDIFDEANSVTVLLTSGSLSSVIREAVLNGANACAIESVVDGVSCWEILQFRTATLIAANTYTISGLLRGRRGTEASAAVSAPSGRKFVLLGGAAGFARIRGEVAEINMARLYKSVTTGQALADATPAGFTNTARALRPYSPVRLGGGRDASGNLTINWLRRTRLGGEWVDGIDASLNEAAESYAVEVWDSGYTTLKRTINAATPTASYSAADQTTDFGSPQATVYLRIYQLSASVGRGAKLQGSI